MLLDVRPLLMFAQKVSEKIRSKHPFVSKQINQLLLLKIWMRTYQRKKSKPQLDLQKLRQEFEGEFVLFTCFGDETQ